MLRMRFGEVERFTPSFFCKGFAYTEGEVSYPIEKICFKRNARGCVVEFPIDADEHFYGLGLQLACFDFAGRKAVVKTNADACTTAGDSHAPVPFIVSTKGYGIYIDTARYMEAYFHRRKGKAIACSEQVRTGTAFSEIYAERTTGEDLLLTLSISACQGVDIYLFEGRTITEIVSQYNRLAGGGCNPPEWGLQTIYRCHMYWNEERVLSLADELKKRDMPVGIIGLEPGWQSNAYSCSFVWDENRFPNAKRTVEKLYEAGYHVNLWEHAFTHSTSPLFAPLKTRSGEYSVWDGLVPDFAYADTAEIFAKYHAEKVTFGLIDGFKLDECDGSDYTGGWTFPNHAQFPSGMDGEQYHSLFGALYMQTMLKVTGNDTLSQVRNAGALCASYPFVLYSDLYDHKSFIRGLATAGFSGLLWSPELRHAESKEDLLRRLQTVVFSPQCLINAFYCDDLPWRELDCEAEVRALLKLRKRLIPMLKRAFQVYQKTGKPPVRALVSDFTDDSETYKLDDEYLFCESLLVAPMVCGERSRKVYLPKGNWRDFFTKEAVPCGWIEVETDGIPVYEQYMKKGERA